MDTTQLLKGVLDVAASDEQAAAEGTPMLLRAVANVMMGRGADAMKDLSHASVASRTESMLWRSLALAQQGKWSEAREGLCSELALRGSSGSAFSRPSRLCLRREAGNVTSPARDFPFALDCPA